MKYIKAFTIPALGLLFIGWVLSLDPQAVGTDELPLWWVLVCVVIVVAVGVIGWVRETRKENARNAPKIMVVTATGNAPRKFNFLGLLIIVVGAWLFYELVIKNAFGG